MSNDFTELKKIDKTVITGGVLSTSIGIKESLEPALRKGVDVMLPKLTDIARGNSAIGTGVIAFGIIGITYGIISLTLIKVIQRSEKNQKANDAKGTSEKDNK
jgi:hypothetical protein